MRNIAFESFNEQAKNKTDDDGVSDLKELKESLRVQNEVEAD